MKTTIKNLLSALTAFTFGYGAVYVYQLWQIETIKVEKGDWRVYLAGVPQGGVVLYGTPSCPACKAARNYLRKQCIVFVDRDITQSVQAKQQHAQLGAHSVPVLLIGDQKISGFYPHLIEAALHGQDPRQDAYKLGNCPKTKA